MAKAIFNVLFKVIKSVIDTLMTPINLLVSSLFPDLSNILNVFNSACEQLLGPTLGWFSHLLPPNTRSLILLYFAILIGYYTVIYSVHLITKVIYLIKKVKIW